MIHFNSSVSSPKYLSYLQELNENYFHYRNKIFSERCLTHLQKKFDSSRLFLCSSATDALEMIAILLDLKAGDEVIMPSFTFVSTANAFVSRGVTPVFVDIQPENGNLDPRYLIEALSERTKAVVLVHYIGICADIKLYKNFCHEHKLFLIEDAAMAYGNKADDKALGTHGDFGVISFDITKQVSAIQGGLLLVNNPKFQERAQNIYHIGTNRTEFEQGNKPYYEWVDLGSKFQMSELNAAFLFDQLGNEEVIFKTRNHIIKSYHDRLLGLHQQGDIHILQAERIDEALHAFVIVLKTNEVRKKLQAFLKKSNIEVMFHYIPLHTSPMGKKIGRYVGGNETVQLAERILRLPVHLEITEDDVLTVCEQIESFFMKSAHE